MSNNHYPRRLLDDAIDRAVHDMVQADPRPGFRRRVIGKLNAPPPRRSWIPNLLVPAGALATVAFAVMLTRTPSLPPEPSVATTPPRNAAPAGAVATAPSTPAPPAPQAAAVAGPRRPARRSVEPVQFTFGPPTDRVAASSVAPAPAESAVVESPSLADSAPVLPLLQVAPLRSLAPVTVKPIEITRIELAPPSSTR